MAYANHFDVRMDSDDESLATPFDPYHNDREDMLDIRSIDDREAEPDEARTPSWTRAVVATVAVGAVFAVAGTQSGRTAATTTASALVGIKTGTRGMPGESDVDDTVNECTSDLEETYFRCPPGSYLNNTEETKLRKQERLMALQAKLKDLGYVKNDRADYKAEYSGRGYATYESPVWLKPEECQTLPDEDWTAEYNAYYYQYQPDHAPSYITKQVYQDYKLEFHDNWKVASTSFSSYLPCEYGSFDKVTESDPAAEGYIVASTSFSSYLPCEYGSFDKVTESDPAAEGYIVAAPVRYPVSRFVSAIGELMQRSMNHYCPSGYCQSSDSFDNETLWKLQHQTTWYPLMCNETKLEYNETSLRWETVPKCTFDYDRFPEIVKAFVHDKKCNYYFYAAEHFVSQSAFVTQNSGCAADLDAVIRLEELDDGLAQLAHLVGKTQSCDMGDSNSASNKPGGLPSESATMAILKQLPELMKDVCMIYAQDFICYDYELPVECKDLF